MSKNVLIIGASSGIGEGLAKVFVENGYTVGVAARRIEKLKHIQKQNPLLIQAFELDVNDTDELKNALEKIATSMGAIDVVVFSAGVGELNIELNERIVNDTLQTNVLGFVNAINWAFNYFVKKGGGHLVGISSIGGLLSSAHAPDYNASKAFQISYLKSLRKISKAKSYNIHVCDVRPGLVDTQMAKGDKLIFKMPVEKVSHQIYKAIINKKKTVYVSKRWAWIGRLARLMD